MQQLYIIKKMINITIRATYYIFCCRNRNWDGPDLMQLWFLSFSFFFFLAFVLFCFCFCLFFVCFFFFIIIQSQAAFVNCLYVARFTIVHSKTQIKFPLSSSSSSSSSSSLLLSLLLLLLLLLLSSLLSLLLLLLLFTRQSLQIKKTSFQILCKALQCPPWPFPHDCGLFSTKSLSSACLTFGKGNNLLLKPNISSISFTIYVHVP